MRDENHAAENAGYAEIPDVRTSHHLSWNISITLAISNLQQHPAMLA